MIEFNVIIMLNDGWVQVVKVVGFVRTRSFTVKMLINEKIVVVMKLG